jgi:type I restriction enzyme M protein
MLDALRAMPATLDLLPLLTRDELLLLARRLDIDVDSRAHKHALVGALVGAKPAAVRAALPDLSRERLKELCRKLGLDDSGREKAPIVARLVNGSAPPALASVSRPPPGVPAPKSAPPRPSPVPPSSSGIVTLAELESHLWEAANILRGSPVDRTDWKSFILPLLFFKRICDVWDEEHDAMVAEYGQDFPDEHRFQIPDECHWSDVRSAAKNVGGVLSQAMHAVEAANQKHLFGVFGDAQWTNKERLPDDLLKDLLEHFSALSLGNQRVASDVMGDAYEYLIKQFADATNKKAGEFYTPRSVVRLIVDMLDPKAGETIYDPACGTGGMLLAAVAHARERGDDPRSFFGKLYAQEKNLTTAAVARMNLFLHGIEDFSVERGDTLREPKFSDPSTGGLAIFDVVIANPPFSLEAWGREVWENDKWGRAFAGLPTDSSGDFAWVQHMIMSMADKTGRMGVVLPQGALFRGGVEGEIRKKLLTLDLVEAVIGLAPNLFYGTGLAACILVLRKRKPAARRGKVLVVDASSLFRKGRAQNYLDPAHAADILGWYERFEEVADRTRVVTLADIENEGGTLNISRYVLPPIGADIPPLPGAVAAFKEALARCREAEDKLRRVMVDGGWLS